MLFNEYNLNFQELKLISLLGSDAKYLYLRPKEESRIRWLAESSLFVDEAVAMTRDYNFNAVIEKCEGGLEITINGVTNFIALPSDLATRITFMHSWLMIHKIMGSKNYVSDFKNLVLPSLQTIDPKTLAKFLN